MKIKSRSKKPVDPSNFLRALTGKISEFRHTPFNFNSQQDAAEVLQFVIDELKGTAVQYDFLGVKSHFWILCFVLVNCLGGWSQ